jgi:hypothetical protein
MLILDLGELLAKHAFVGIADRHMGLGLVQHGTRLFLLNYVALA